MGLGSFIKKAVGVVTPVLGAATGNPLLGALGTGIGGALATEDAQDFASSSAATANAFTKEQLQNRHQWEVNDLRAAGLNPILSAMRGAPSIGGSASASTSANVAQDASALENAQSNRANSASAANQQKLNTQKLQAEIDLMKSNAEASKSQAVASQTQGVKNIADSNLSRTEMEKILAQLPSIESSARNQKTEQDTFLNKYIRPRTKAFADTLGDFTGAIGNVFRGSAGYHSYSKN